MCRPNSVTTPNVSYLPSVSPPLSLSSSISKSCRVWLISWPSAWQASNRRLRSPVGTPRPDRRGGSLEERVEQRLGLLQVRSLKALGEPAVDRCQQLASRHEPALLLPQASEAHGGPQFQRFGLLAAGDVEGPL